MTSQIPLIMLTAVASCTLIFVVLASWRLGVITLLAALPFTDLLQVGNISSGMKALTVVVAFSILVRIVRDGELRARLVTNAKTDLSVCVLALATLSLVSTAWAASGEAALQRTLSYIGVFTLMHMVALLDGPSLRLGWQVLTWSAALSVPVGFLIAGDYVDVFEAGRFTSGGLNPNDYAGLLLVTLFVGGAGIPWRGLLPVKGVLLASIVVGILLSGSRTALVALALAPLAFWIAFPRRAGLRVGGRVLATYAGAVLVGVAVLLGTTERTEVIQERAQSLGEYEDDRTWAGRLDIWFAGASMFRDHPLIGVGSGNFSRHSPEYSLVAKGLDDLRPGSAVAHNMFLGLATELGMAGLTIFVLLLYRAFHRVRWRGDADTLAAGLFLGLIGYVLMGMTLTWEHAKIGYVLFGAVLSISGAPRQSGTS